MLVAQKSTRPAYLRFYTVAGRLLCVEAHDRWASDLYQRFFAGFYFNPFVEGDGRKPDATIRIHVGENPPPVPLGLESFHVAAGGRCYYDDAHYYLQEADALALINDSSAPFVEVWIGSQVRRELAALARLVFNTTMAALRQCQLFELHGGGVVEPNSGAGVLIIGPSGSGKSTLTTHLAASGWLYLSDDSLLLYQASNDVKACALRRAFSVTEKTIAAGMSARLENATTDPVPFDPDKRRFIPQDVFMNGSTEQCTPRVLCFPVITHEPASSSRKLSQYEVMTLLLKMCPWACYDKLSARQHLKMLSVLSKQTVAYELLSGEDLLCDPEYTATLLSKLLSDHSS